LDTRKKIVDADRAARIALGGGTLVSGYFDPLMVAHAERLAALKIDDKDLLALIATPDKPIFPAAARAELVASLRCVDYVAELTDSLTPQVRFEREDSERFAALVKHVHARQGVSS
jgi:hypothetical protein